MNRFKTVLAFTFLAGLFLACGGEDAPANKDELSSGAQAANGKTLYDLVDHFKQAGIPVTGIKKRLYDRLGAADGFAMTIADKPVEIYLFQASDSDQTAQLKNYESNGITLSADFTLQPIIRGEFLLLPAELNPHWNDIKSAFDTFSID